MFTNCVDSNVCQRDNAIDQIMSNFVEANNKRMNYNWETDYNKWENWDSKYYIFIFILIKKKKKKKKKKK